MALVARTENELKAVAEDLPGPSLVVSGDVTDEDFNEAVADAAVAEWGGLDVWIANAGISPIVAGPRETDASVWRRVLEVNLTGAFLGARAAARVMGEGGRLIFTGSVLGERPRQGLAAYSASKAGLAGMAKSLALDLAPAGDHGQRRRAGVVRLAAGRRVEEQRRAVGDDHRAHRPAAVGSHHRPGRRLPVPGLGRIRVHHRHRAQRRRRVPARMTGAAEQRRRVVAITGAGGALGAAISRRLAGEPATDLVLSDVSAPSLDATVAGLDEATGKVETALADVSEVDQVRSVVDLAVERFGRLDVLISNAGVLSPNGRIHNLTTEDWERAFRINVLGAVNGIRAAVPVMRSQRSGSIVLTASVSGLTAWSHAAPYCATKAAVIQLAKVAAVEYARDGIRVNCVCPGTFRSAIHDDLPPEALEAIEGRHPLGLGTADDLVGAYSYLAGEGSRWTTGSALVVDGGYSAP